jgi:hypothetical protein
MPPALSLPTLSPSSVSSFGPAGGIFAATFLGGTFYVVELENGGSREFLGTMPHDGALIGQGQRIGETPVGFENVEGMAAVDGGLVATSISFAGHTTMAIRALLSEITARRLVTGCPAVSP